MNPGSILDEFEKKLERLNKPIIQKSDLHILAEVIAEKSEKSGQPGFKFPTNEEMLEAIGCVEPNPEV
jgi:hypothetical protein